MADHTVTLSPDWASFVDEKVTSGAYRSTMEVVNAGLRALKGADEALERWLIDEVAPVYDEMAASPDLAIPANTVFEELRALYAARDTSGP